MRDLDPKAAVILKDICRRFTGDCTVLVTGCATALGGGDHAEIGRLAHLLHGQCLALGLGGLVEAANELEQSVKNGALSEVVPLVGSLLPLVGRAQIALSAACAAAIPGFNENEKPAQP